MLRRLAVLLLVFSAAVLAQGQSVKDELDALKRRYEAMLPGERDYWAFLNGIAKEERDILALMGRAKALEEEAARSPGDKELQARAAELSARATREAEEHDKRIPSYRQRLDLRMRKIEAFFKALEELHKKYPEDDGVAILRVRCFADQGAIANVRGDAERLFAAHPDDREARWAFAQSCMVVPVPARQPDLSAPPRFGKAFEALEPLAKAEPASQEVQLLYGVAASALGKNEAAAGALDAVASITSVWPPVRIVIGNAQDPEDAFAIWKNAAKSPNDVEARRLRARLLFQVEAPENAILDAEFVLKAAPEDLEAKKLLARSYSRAKRFEDAAPLYASLAEEMDKDQELRAEHAVFLYGAGKAAESLAELAKIKDTSGFPPRLNDLLTHMLLEGRGKRPDDWRLEAFFMKRYADGGSFYMIRDAVDKLWAKHQDDASLRFMYAATLMCVPLPNEDRDPRQRGVEPRPPRFDEAYTLLGPLVAAEPANEEYLLLHGVAACAIGKDAEARKELDAVGSVGSMRPAVRILLGSTKDPAGIFEKWRSVAAGLVEHPDDPAAHLARAELLLQVDAARFAIPDGEIALKAKPGDKAARIALGRAYFAANRFEKAIEAFGDPPPDEAAGEYAAALFDANRIAEFKAIWEKTPDRRSILNALAPAAGQVMQVNGRFMDNYLARWKAEEKARAKDEERDDDPRVELETSRGKIVLELYEDSAPNTVANFVWLVENGFYDGIAFHRILAGFMAQGGDPTGTGTGGPGYDIKDELAGNLRYHWRGTLSMAKTNKPNSANSQFFLCFVPCPHLDAAEGPEGWRGYTVFGRIVAGQEVADLLVPKDSLVPGDAIVKARVLRKRNHEYKPEKIPVPGATEWKPKKD